MIYVKGNNLDVMKCLEGLIACPVDEPLPDIRTIDGAAVLVHTRPPKIWCSDENI